jgi:acyl-CoA synthetase (AMP-forming)/AMP-acid ligase II
MTARAGLPAGIDRWPTGLQTIGHSLAVSAKRFPKKLALSHPSGELTYRELDERVNQLAHCLISRGVSHGAHVGVLFGNTLEHVITLYAVARIGAVSVVLDPKWVGREIFQALKIFDCNYLVYDLATGDSTFHEGIGAERCKTLVFDRANPGASDFDRALRDFPRVGPDTEVSDDDVFLIMLTSGTTGIPKGCIKTHKSYAHSCALAAIGSPIDHNSKELIVVPIYYNSGRASLVTLLLLGGTVYLREKFVPREALDAIQRERITCLALAPTQCNELLASTELDKFDTSSLLFLRKAGLPFQTRTVEDIINRLCPHLYQGYGGTEFSTATLLYPDEQLSKPGSAGRALFGVEVEIVDDDKRPLPCGEQGEVRVRSASVCVGYYKNEAANRSIFVDGWYHSGDLGYLDADGYLFIVGRKKDIVKTGGVNVAPREVEDVILAFPEVADVAVIGVQDPKWGEAIKALVVLKPGCQLTEAELLDRCRPKLSRYKLPKMVQFMDKLPRSPLGKITTDFRATQQT